MTALPRITLVMPSLRAASTIERTLRSIEGQAYPNLQLISVDGGSDDGTLEILDRHRDLLHTRLVGKDRNAADALNRGFARADGEIHGWLNADDELAPGALAAIARFLAEDPATDVVTGGCRRVFADGSELVTQVPDRYLVDLPLRNGIEQPSTFWRASLHRRLGTLDDSYRLAFDWEWWNRMRRAGARFRRVERVLSVYHFSDSNLTSRGGMEIVREMQRVTRTYGPCGGTVAWAYRFLFHAFDLRGCYDRPFHELPRRQRLVFGAALRTLSAIFGRDAVHCYNWNWASKQVRGVVWYK